ncbi:MAG TPA: hypothetical protein VFS05_11155 [Gemmatimonadaceae bacterium]|nr:hypothetical protein [Gemmatimonadaceae bacterium]
MRRAPGLLVLVAGGVSLAACRGDARPSRGGADAGAGGAASSRETTRAAFVAESIAGARDEWNPAEVVKRLTEAGLVVADSGDTVRQPFLSVPGRLIKVGGYDLQLYLYPDTLARSSDSRTLDSARVAPHGEFIDWKQRPWLITSGNLLAILLTPREQLAERVTLTLTARHLGIGR